MFLTQTNVCSSDTDSEKWSNISKELTDLIHNCVFSLDNINENMHYLVESAVEKQFSFALGKYRTIYVSLGRQHVEQNLF